MLTENHEKDLAWTEIWKLQDKSSTGEFNYYKGLTLEERQHLIDLHRENLDYAREIRVATTGKALGAADDSKSTRKDEGEKAQKISSTLSIHDSKHYSFGEGKLWIPWATEVTSGSKRGQYAKGYPTGMILHWTAGHRNGIKEGNNLMRSTGMLYLLGDKDGNIAQSDALKYHGYHAGASSHKYASGYVSDEWVGLELQAAGQLTKKGDQYLPWFSVPVAADEVVHSKSRENIQTGYYHMFTEAQMLATRKLVCWLFLNNPDIFSIDRVCGHDEVSPGRKCDPGASPTDGGNVLTMSEFRKLCWNDVDKINELRKKA
jgi:hypothetical protein